MKHAEIAVAAGATGWERGGQIGWHPSKLTTRLADERGGHRPSTEEGRKPWPAPPSPYHRVLLSDPFPSLSIQISPSLSWIHQFSLPADYFSDLAKLCLVQFRTQSRILRVLNCTSRSLNRSLYGQHINKLLDPLDNLVNLHGRRPELDDREYRGEQQRGCCLLCSPRTFCG